VGKTSKDAVAKRAFVLAAGHGTRLRPVSHQLPKPLVPVLGRPALELVLERIFDAGIREIGINLHYEKERISDWIDRSRFAPYITRFEEIETLGTAGALDNAREFLSEGSFLLHNADILSDIDLTALIERHRRHASRITLAVHDRPGLNTLRIDKQGRLVNVVRQKTAKGRPVPGLRAAAFTGIAVYDPEFLQHVPPFI